MDAAELDSLIEDAVPVTAAAQFVPGRPNTSTVWRWCSRGVRGVKLQTFFVGGRRMTSKRFIAEFLERLNAGNPAADEHADVQRRGREAGKALEALEALGC